MKDCPFVEAPLISRKTSISRFLLPELKLKPREGMSLGQEHRAGGGQSSLKATQSCQFPKVIIFLPLRFLF